MAEIYHAGYWKWIGCKPTNEFYDEIDTDMNNNRQIIEIGEIRCAVSFEERSFEKEFGAVLSDYRRWGFCTRGEP